MIVACPSCGQANRLQLGTDRAGRFRCGRCRTYLVAPSAGTHAPRGAGGETGPSSVCGTGTRFYGRRHTGSGGTSIATKWATLLYFPVWPLSALEIEEVKEIASGIKPAGKHNIRSKVPLGANKAQIVKTMLAAYSILFLVVFAFRAPWVLDAKAWTSVSDIYSVIFAAASRFDVTSTHGSFVSIALIVVGVVGVAAILWSSWIPKDKQQ